MGEDNLQSELSTLALNDSYDVQGADRLLQVEKAVDAARATIVQQLAENNRLRIELQRKNEELRKYKLGYANDHSPPPDDMCNEQENKTCVNDQMVLHSENQICGNGYVDTGPRLSDFVYQNNVMKRNENWAIGTAVENQIGNSVNGSLNMIPDHQVDADKAGVSYLPGTLSISARYNEFNSDSEFRNPGVVSVSTAEGSGRLIAKQDILQKNHEQEMEILQLKNYLAEYSLKEAKLCQETQDLEKNISHMHLVFNQQQQDLSFSVSKANSYKQDIMEENVRLSYALQAAKEEESRFVEFLISLLAKNGIEIRVADAQSIVSSVKVLFRHLQEQLRSSQDKLKEMEYQLAPWQLEKKNGLELVPQPLYSGSKMPNAPQHMGIIEDAVVFPQTELDDLGRNSSPTGRNIASDNVFSPDAYLVPKDEGPGSRKVTFEDSVSRELDEPESRGNQDGREPSISRNKKHASGILDDPKSYPPSLPTVLEEPWSSFSEAAEDDPLPAIEGLQILGKPCPGEELHACGYSVHGTTSCNFEWVRHLEDGSFNYINGAKRPTYLVTADDVDTYLAIEVQPLDNRKRKGELVKVFANDHRKIPCDPLMLECVEKNLYSGHASFNLSIPAGFLDLWEPATLSIKRGGYSIKSSGTNGGVVSKKFSSSMIVSILPESPTDFSIIDPTGAEEILRAEKSTGISCSRDTIVLTLRLFILKATEKKKKSKRRSLFFNF